jgi:erythromycin esterase-like protein
MVLPEADAMTATSDSRLTDTLRHVSHVLSGAGNDYDPLIEWFKGTRFALLGEASHGTHEFYRERAEITKRLIVERGFTAVAIEGDWPDASRVNRYVRGLSDDATAVEALTDFKRFPSWMWRNTDVVAFIEWLRARNDALAPHAAKSGFYGLDLYSLHASMEAVLRYLDKIDPPAAGRVRERYACFDHFGDDVQRYGLLTTAGVAESCRDEVIGVLLDLQRRAAAQAERDGRIAKDEFFDAEQNARLVKDAEAYYRSMFLSDVSSWNLRDRHMAETLDALVAYLERKDGHPAKVVVWAHNSHVGDARATEMGQRGELNVGQLVRQRYGRTALNVGFSTHHGTVTAASNWDGPADRKRVRTALAGSYEMLFHETQMARFLLRLGDGDAAQALNDPRLQRAIGVIYRPETERQSHYFHARLASQFDAVVHFDETRAVEPLERTAGWEAGEVPETFPFGV